MERRVDKGAYKKLLRIEVQRLDTGLACPNVLYRVSSTSNPEVIIPQTQNMRARDREILNLELFATESSTRHQACCGT